MTRLIDLVEAQDRLLAAIAAVPIGVRISIPQLRDHLVSQSDVLGAIQTLIDCGKLDRETLRPPQTCSPSPRSVAAESPSPAAARGGKAEARCCGRKGQKKGAEPSRPLYDALIAEAKARGMSVQAVSLAIWNNKARIYQLAKMSTVAGSTARRCREWIEARPNTLRAGEREQTGPVPRSPAPAPVDDGPTGAEMAAALDALIATHELSKTRVGMKLTGCKGGVEILRKRATITPLMVDRVRALLADPPIAELRGPRSAKASAPAKKGAAVGRVGAPTKDRDPTEPPPTPLMDLAEKQRRNGQRHVAAVRRGREAEATRKLDAGEKPKNSFELSLMSNIERRREEAKRQADPVEQAKLALQRRGRVVHSATIHGGRRGYFIVGGQRDPRTGRLREISPAELLDLAEKATGLVFRRVAAAASPHTNPGAPAADLNTQAGAR
jgi:hypothetical protein